MFLDNYFFKKASLAFICNFLTILCLTFLLTHKADTALRLQCIACDILAFIGIATIEGYKISVINSLNSDNKFQILPNLNFKKNLTIGFKYCISSIMLHAPFLIIKFPFMLAFGLSVSFSLPVVFYVSLWILIFLVALKYIYIACFFPASTIIFIKHNSIWSFYKFEEIFKVASINKKEYMQSAIIIFILNTLAILVQVLLCGIFVKQPPMHCFIALFASACLVTYNYYVTSYLIAKIKNNTGY